MAQAVGFSDDAECPPLDLGFMPCPEKLDVGFESVASGSDNDTETSGDEFRFIAESRGVSPDIGVSPSAECLPRCSSSTAVSRLPGPKTAMKYWPVTNHQPDSQGLPRPYSDYKTPLDSFGATSGPVGGDVEALAMCGIGQEAPLLSDLSRIEPLEVLEFNTGDKSDWYSGDSNDESASGEISTIREVCSQGNVSDAKPYVVQPVETVPHIASVEVSAPETGRAGPFLSASGQSLYGFSGHSPSPTSLSGPVCDSGLTSLQQQFKALFGRATNSTNALWLQQRICTVLQVQAPVAPAGSRLPFDNTALEMPGSPPKLQLVTKPGSKNKSSARKRKNDVLLEQNSEVHTPKHHAVRSDHLKSPGTSSRTATPTKKVKTGAVPPVSMEAKVNAEELVGSESDDDDAYGSDHGGGGKGKRKNLNPWYRFWTLEETQALVDGVDKCGGGKWADIKKLSFSAIDKRSAVDLKDKWRNLIRIAMLPAEQVKLDKKREATCPPELLAQVREISSREDLRKQHKIDGRMNRGRPRSNSLLSNAPPKK